jgi:hypothetical protein
VLVQFELRDLSFAPSLSTVVRQLGFANARVVTHTALPPCATMSSSGSDFPAGDVRLAHLAFPHSAFELMLTMTPQTNRGQKPRDRHKTLSLIQLETE